jgi:hypothetical protein
MQTDPKALPPAQRLKYIVEVMKMRERGRTALLRASQRRRHRMAKKSSTDWHTHLGLVDDADFGDWNFRKEEVCLKNQTLSKM